MGSRSVPQQSRTRWLLLLALLLFLGHVASYWRFLSDDALISLRYADRFVDGKGLTWTDGERVEGYTDLLWVLLTAGLHALGVDLIWAAQGLAFIGCLAGVLLLAIDPGTTKPSWERILAGSLGLALCPPVAIWAIGGLEHGFMVGIIVGVLFFISRASRETDLGKATWTTTALLCALVLLRADAAVLVFGLVLPCAAFSAHGAIKRFFLWALLPLAVLGMQHLFRHSYYGEWVPNTAAAKVALSSERVSGGFLYVGRGLLALWPVLIAAAVAFGLAVRKMRPSEWAPALSTMVIWCLYLALMGGDIFPGWRQLLPGLVPVYFLLAQSSSVLAKNPLPIYRQVLTLGALAAAGLGLVTQSLTPENLRGRQERWEWVGASVGPVLKRAFGKQQPLLAVDAAGALPYWSELPSLDLLGLNDYHIAHHPPEDFGSGTIGHDLGDGAYALSRKPDLIAFNNAGGTRVPLFLSGMQMERTREFRQKYSLARIRGLPPLSHIGEIHVRVDGKVGFETDGSTTIVPGYFFSEGLATAELGPDGQLTTVAYPGQVASMYGLHLTPGTYELHVDAEGPPLKWKVRCRNRSLSHASPAKSPGFRVGTDPISVHFATKAGRSSIRAVRFDRVPTRPAPHCSTGRVRLPLANLAKPKPENHPWDAPGNAVFPGAELLIQAPSPIRPPHLQLSVDNNDTYVLRFFFESRQVGSTSVSPKDNGGGLANHRVTVPDEARRQGFDEIRISATSGDGAVSVGHLIPMGNAQSERTRAAQTGSSIPASPKLAPNPGSP